jgi:hypothetical protein
MVLVLVVVKVGNGTLQFVTSVHVSPLFTQLLRSGSSCQSRIAYNSLLITHTVNCSYVCAYTNESR